MRSALNAAIGSAGVASASVAYAYWYGRGVKRTDVPEWSALRQLADEQHSWYADCYVLAVPRPEDRPRSYSGVRETDDFVKAFFRSTPMTLELQLAHTAGARRASSENILALELEEGDKIGPFRVVARGAHEVLFETQYATYTWLSYREARVGGGGGGGERRAELRLGSVLGGGGYKGVPLHTVMLYRVLMPFHDMYSRVLLRSAADRLALNGR